MCNLEAYKMFFEGRKQRINAENTGRGWVIVCFKIFENRTCDHSLVLAPYLLSDSLFQFFWKNNSRPLSSSSFIFKWLKTWWVNQLGLYKTSMSSRGKDAMIKDFKLEIRIYFDSPNIEPPYTKHLISSPLLYQMEQFSKGYRMVFELQMQRNNVWGFDHRSVLKCSLTSLSALLLFVLLCMIANSWRL
jgi:hypothetical protein